MDGKIPIDTQYTLAISQMRNNDFTFRGYTNSKIGYDDSKENWVIQIDSGSNMHAITNGSVPPFGTKEYLLSEELGGGHMLLNINACDDNNHFNCKDGSCIPIEKRCDSKFDCNDDNDESECRMIHFPASYLSHVPGKCFCIFSCNST